MRSDDTVNSVEGHTEYEESTTQREEAQTRAEPTRQNQW